MVRMSEEALEETSNLQGIAGLVLYEACVASTMGKKSYRLPP